MTENSKYTPEFANACEKFYANYKSIASYGTNQAKDVFLGDKNNQVCRFCGRKKGEVTFKKKAHALSNLIGNNRLFSYYECDECNGNRFSKYESDFSNYMKLLHCLSQIKGKRGIPSYKSRKDDFTRVDIKDCISVLQKEDETAIALLDKKNKIIHFKGERTYTPVNVYKCLLKMALTVMPDSELPEITNAMDFLMDRKYLKEQLLVGYRQYAGFPPFSTPVTMLFKRKDERVDENVPLYMFLLAYGNFAFQFQIPFCPADKFLVGKEISMPYIPTIADTINPQRLTGLDFSSSEKITKEEYGIDMTFEGMKRNWIVTLNYVLQHPWDSLKRLLKNNL
jgi:transcriptional regulator, abrB family protein